MTDAMKIIHSTLASITDLRNREKFQVLVDESAALLSEKENPSPSLKRKMLQSRRLEDLLSQILLEQRIKAAWKLYFMKLLMLSAA